MKSLLITGITLLCISALLFYFSTGYNLEEVQPSHFMGVLGGIGIGLIIGRYKFVNMLGGKLEVANLTESVKKIFEMSGILRLIPVANLDETFFNKAM